MNKTKSTVSFAQKKAQRKYDQKTKMVSIKYTPYDIKEFEQLKEYLEQTNQSVNGFIKQLIRNFFIEGCDKEKQQINDPVVKKQEQELTHQPFIYIDEENIQILFDLLGEKLAVRFLDEYYELIQPEMENILEEKGYVFDEWITNIEKQVTDGEINYDTKNELYEIMFDSLRGEV